MGYLLQLGVHTVEWAVSVNDHPSLCDCLHNGNPKRDEDSSVIPLVSNSWYKTVSWMLTLFVLVEIVGTTLTNITLNLVIVQFIVESSHLSTAMAAMEYIDENIAVMGKKF